MIIFFFILKRQIIVKEERNDAGKVSKINSIKVTESFTVSVNSKKENEKNIKFTSLAF